MITDMLEWKDHEIIKLLLHHPRGSLETSSGKPFQDYLTAGVSTTRYPRKYPFGWSSHGWGGRPQEKFQASPQYRRRPSLPRMPETVQELGGGDDVQMSMLQEALGRFREPTEEDALSPCGNVEETVENPTVGTLEIPVMYNDTPENVRRAGYLELL